MITAQILSPYGWSHYESQKQDDGKEALVLVPGDVRLPYVSQFYNGRHRGWTDILALPSQQVKGCAVIEMWFDESRVDDMKALTEIQADPLCGRLDAGAKLAIETAKVVAIIKCDAKVLETVKTDEELRSLATAWLKIEAAKLMEVKPIEEEPIEIAPVEDVVKTK